MSCQILNCENMKNLKLIIFDWDDVFTLGSKEGYFACYHKAIAGVGIRLSKNEEKKRILAKWGKPHQVEIQELLKEHTELVGNASKIYEQNFNGDTFINQLTYVEGANNLLTKLAKKYKLAVATGQQPKMYARIEEKFNIPKVFSKMIFSYDIKDPKKTKPHPYSLEKIMKDLGIRSSETVFVGDAKTDVEMAKRAKVVPVVVLTGHLTRTEAEKLQVEYIIEKVTNLRSIL